MQKLFYKRSQKSGLPPGSLVHIGEEKVRKVGIHVFDYDRDHFREFRPGDVAECFPLLDRPSVTWINVTGLQDPGIIESLGDRCGIHPLVLEDILNTSQRPKIEEFEKHLFIVLRMMAYNEDNDQILTEQTSLILGPAYVISFQEHEEDVFDSVRARIRTGKGSLRRNGADYLAYALTDCIVDNYFLILEKNGERIEFLEEGVVANPSPSNLQELHRLKRDMILLRKSVWPLREVIAKLERGDLPLIRDRTRIYFRDTYDHTIQVIDTLETFRDMTSGMLDIYLSSVSNRMNEIMKTLTIIATIFIPLTFVAGLYGMNFRYMPELGWRYGYFAVLVVMLCIGVGMFLYLKRKKWL